MLCAQKKIKLADDNNNDNDNNNNDNIYMGYNPISLMTLVTMGVL